MSTNSDVEVYVKWVSKVDNLYRGLSERTLRNRYYNTSLVLECGSFEKVGSASVHKNNDAVSPLSCRLCSFSS